MNSPPPPYGSIHSAPSTWSSRYALPGGETTPLNADGWRKRAMGRHSRMWTLLALLFMVILFIGQNAGLVSTLADDVPASQKAAMRERWQRETDKHLDEVVQWTRERADHQQELRLWKIEREVRERDRETWKKQVETEHGEWWAKETKDREEWKRKVEAERQEWRTKETREREAWKRKVEAERHGWAREGEEWARRREEEERHRKDVERERQGVWWSEPWKNKGCYASGIQAYSAHLFDIPGDLNWFDVCMNMPIRIEGRMFDRPNKCERDNTHVWATWMVDVPQCTLYWDRLRSMGCSPGQSGMRRYRARLMNLHRGDDWDKMCSTTPANILGVHYDHPTICVHEEGRTGIWDYPDPRCH